MKLLILIAVLLSATSALADFGKEKVTEAMGEEIFEACDDRLSKTKVFIVPYEAKNAPSFSSKDLDAVIDAFKKRLSRIAEVYGSEEAATRHLQIVFSENLLHASGGEEELELVAKIELIERNSGRNLLTDVVKLRFEHEAFQRPYPLRRPLVLMLGITSAASFVGSLVFFAEASESLAEYDKADDYEAAARLRRETKQHANYGWASLGLSLVSGSLAYWTWASIDTTTYHEYELSVQPFGELQGVSFAWSF